MDYSRFDRLTLYDMREIAWSNLHGVMPEEREFWENKFNAISEALLRRPKHEDFDIPRAVSGAGWTPFVPTHPDFITRELQAGTATLDPPSRVRGPDAGSGDEHRQAKAGIEKLQRLRRTPHKDPE